jgi:hypothetical protein
MVLESITALPSNEALKAWCRTHTFRFDWVS